MTATSTSQNHSYLQLAPSVARQGLPTLPRKNHRPPPPSVARHDHPLPPFPPRTTATSNWLHQLLDRTTHPLPPFPPRTTATSNWVHQLLDKACHLFLQEPQVPPTGSINCSTGPPTSIATFTSQNHSYLQLAPSVARHDHPPIATFPSKNHSYLQLAPSVARQGLPPFPPRTTATSNWLHQLLNTTTHPLPPLPPRTTATSNCFLQLLASQEQQKGSCDTGCCFKPVAYRPQTLIVSMLQPAAASCTRPEHLMRCITWCEGVDKRGVKLDAVAVMPGYRQRFTLTFTSGSRSVARTLKSMVDRS